jgi:hypothetical protein
VTRVATTVLPDRVEPGLIATPEWRSVCAWRHNVMLEGPAQATDNLLRLLGPHLHAPAVRTCGRVPLALPAVGCGALVLHDVSALDSREQAALASWLDAGGTQVVSTTAHPLLPMIADGVFDEALYYRLNVMLLSIDSTGALA